MARFVDAIDLPLSVEAAFDYLADFSRTVEWDPSVRSSARLTPDPIGVGSRFRVEVSLLGRTLPLEYEITVWERPRRLVFRSNGDGFRSVDEITLAPRGPGTRVTYEARIELAGLRRIADPFLDLVFQRVGRLAARGLRERVAGTPRQRDTPGWAPLASR